MQVLQSAPHIQTNYAPLPQPVQMSMPVMQPIAFPAPAPSFAMVPPPQPPHPPQRPKLQRSEVWLPRAQQRHPIEAPPYHAFPTEVERAYYARHTHPMDPRFKVWSVGDIDDISPDKFGLEVSRVPLPKSWKMMGPREDQGLQMSHDGYAFAVDLGGVGANSYWKVDTPVKMMVAHQTEPEDEDIFGTVGEAMDLIAQDFGDLVHTNVGHAHKGLTKTSEHIADLAGAKY